MKRSHIAIGAAGAVAALAVGALLATTVLAPAQRLAACGESSVAGAAIGGPFELVSETGETVTDADVITEPTLIYFGYTFCPDVCPLDSMRNAQAVDILQERGIDAQAVFVTVDPQRDTPEVVAEFTDNFHEEMLGLTGSPEQVAEAAGAYRVVYNARTEEDPDYYLVDHSVFTYLVLPGEGFVDFFRRDAAPEAVADRVQCFVNATS